MLPENSHGVVGSSEPIARLLWFECIYRFPILLHDRFPADKGRHKSRGLETFVVQIWHNLPPITDTCLLAVLVKETVAGGAAQTQIVKPQERPPKL
jgi:hypothetical protein